MPKDNIERVLEKERYTFYTLQPWFIPGLFTAVAGGSASIFTVPTHLGLIGPDYTTLVLFAKTKKM